MSKRLFALLLAAALVLSMGAAPAASGQPSGTEQTEQGGEVSAQAPDTVETAGDDTAVGGAPVGDEADGTDGVTDGTDGVTDGTDGVTDENDGAADETDGAADENDGAADENDGAADENDGVADENDGAADETDGVADETNGVADETDGAADETDSIADETDEIDGAGAGNGEPQALAEWPASVSVRFEGVEHITSLTAGGADVLPDAKAGTPIVLSAGGEGSVIFSMELETGYDVTAADPNDYASWSGSTLYVYDRGGYDQQTGTRQPGDGNVTVRVMASPKIEVTFTGETEKIKSFFGMTEQAKAGTPIELNVPLNFDGVGLPLELEEHYTVEVPEGCSYNGTTLNLRADTDKNGEKLPLTKLTVKVVPAPELAVTFTGETDRITKLLDPNGNDVTAAAKAGGPVTVYVTSSSDEVDMTMELEDGYTVVETVGNSDYVSLRDQRLGVQDGNDDGKVTVEVAAAPRVDVTFAGETDKITSLTKSDGTDCLAQAKAGTPVSLFTDSWHGYRTSLRMKLEAGYTVRFSYAGEQPSRVTDNYDDAREMLELDSGREGTVRAVTVTVVRSAKFTVEFKGAEWITSVRDAAGTTSYDLSKPVEISPSGTNGATLWIDVKGGYYVQTTDECTTTYLDGAYAYRLNDLDGDGVVTVTVVNLVKVTLVDDGKYVTSVSYYGEHDGNTYEIRQEAELSFEAKACDVDVVGGSVGRKYYHVDHTTGVLYVSYSVRPNGSGDVTIRTKAGDPAQTPVPVKIEYVDPENKILNKDENAYMLPGEWFGLTLAEGYMFLLEGDAALFLGSTTAVQLNEDAKSVKVTAAAIKAGAKLSASIPGAVEPADPYGFEWTTREYVGHGDTMTDGKGWFMLKNGYEVGPGVTGGSVSNKQIMFDEQTGSIHTFYEVDAAADTVNVPIVEVRPYRWVNVKVYDAIETYYLIGGEMIDEGNGSYMVGFEDAEGLIVAADELTALAGAGDPDYEVVAVSGCTLQKETDENGSVTYHVIPDETGDASIELMICKSTDAHEHDWSEWKRAKEPTYGADGEDQKVCSVCGAVQTRVVPALEVKTDAGVSSDVDGLQVDSLAKDKMKGAIGDVMEILTKGGIPDGMSRETAYKLREALENVDPDGPAPVVSAELTVKPAESGAVKGADAVYEIEIGLSVNGEKVGLITELSQAISIGLPLPEVAGRIVYVVRSHEGKQEKLAVVVKDGTITFATNQFSDFAIMSSSDLADAVVAPIPDQTWTGSPITPGVKVTIVGPNGEETLKEGVDYELVYEDNVKVGTAAVTVKGLGDFAGTSVSVTFKIVAAEKTSGAGTAGSGTVPATGDSTPLALYAGLLALGLCGLTAVLLRRGKQR